MLDASPQTFLDRNPNPFFGAHQLSNLEEGTIKEVHVDEANNVTMTATVVTMKGAQKQRVPFLFPYASVNGTAGIFVVPQVGDECLVAHAAGNIAYIIGYHPAPQVFSGRPSAALAQTGASGAAHKGTFAQTQLIPGSIELKTVGGNRLLIHPGGSIAIDSKTDLFTFYDAVKSTVTTLCRSQELFTAGGSSRWVEGEEKSQRSMSYTAELFTKSATKENLSAGPTRGGARMQILFSEAAQHFFLEVTDQNDITSRISIGPNGVILTSSDGVNQGSITVSPSGNFNLIAGDPAGLHTQLDLDPNAIAISAFTGPTVLATVQSTTDGKVNVSSQQQVVVDSPKVNVNSISEIILTAPRVGTQGGQTNLSALGGLGVVRRIQDQVIVFGVQGGSGAASGFAVAGSGLVTAAG